MGMKAEKTIITRQLPKTGQSTVYVIGGDGYYQAGWWKGLKIANNKTRFIAKTFNGDDVVVDRATGLMWAADGAAAGCLIVTSSLIQCITYAEGLTFAGFSDWRVPNLFELLSLMNYEETDLLIPEPPFSNTHWENWYITTTTKADAADYVYMIGMTDGLIYPKIRYFEEYYLRCVRGGL